MTRAESKQGKLNPSYSHGMSNTPTYYSWKSMRERCNLPCVNGYEYYGGKGITYQDSWNKFSNFLADMGTRPEGTTLDRIDSSANYTVDNCRWIDAKENSARAARGKVYKLDRKLSQLKFTLEDCKTIQARIDNGEVLKHICAEYNSDGRVFKRAKALYIEARKW